MHLCLRRLSGPLTALSWFKERFAAGRSPDLIKRLMERGPPCDYRSPYPSCPLFNACTPEQTEYNGEQYLRKDTLIS